MSATEFWVSLGAPPRVLSPNASHRGKSHWAHTAAVKAYRHEAYIAAKQILQLSRLMPPHWAAAAVKVTWCRRRPFPDPDNLIATMKAAFDGLVDAGVLADDNELLHLPPEFLPMEESTRWPISIRVTPLSAAGTSS